MTTILINGDAANPVSPADRGLAYGDGLFETLRISQGRIVFLAEHLARMQAGCQRLGLPFDPSAFEPDLERLLQESGNNDAVLKLLVTRGAGGRGYRPAADVIPTRIASLHPLPPITNTGAKAFVCRTRLAHQPALAGIKHLNRLEQVLASQEWPDDSFMEGLMLDYQDHLIEGTRSNLFMVTDGHICTPDLQACGVAGILRQFLLEQLTPAPAITKIDLPALFRADELFFCNSVLGILPVSSLLSGAETRRYTSHTVTLQAQSLFTTALQTC
jgi:4-amino-4-deoxychorismate lyase